MAQLQSKTEMILDGRRFLWDQNVTVSETDTSSSYGYISKTQNNHFAVDLRIPCLWDDKAEA
jgi:hypothetical protein